MPPSLSLITILSLLSTVTATTIGITYTSTSTTSPPVPPPDQLIPTLLSLKTTTVHLLNPNPTLIRSFTHTNISLLLTIPNNLIPTISSNLSLASLWLFNHVIPFYPRVNITSISVGAHVTLSDTDVILPAIRNIHQSLTDIGINQITVFTTLSFVNIMTTSFPPSSARFIEPVNSLVIEPLLDYLTETNSSFFVSLVPYSVYKLRPEIPIGFALFQQHAFNFREDTVTGVRYRNLFDLMLDAVIVAMAVAGQENIPVVVVETGWPCYDTDDEVDAREVYAKMYLQGLVSHVRSGNGTPLRREGAKEVYVYEMFDRNGSGSEGFGSGGGWQNWGLCYPNMSLKFEIEFSNGGRGGGGGSLTVWYVVLFLVHVMVSVNRCSLWLVTGLM